MGTSEVGTNTSQATAVRFSHATVQIPLCNFRKLAVKVCSDIRGFRFHVPIILSQGHRAAYRLQTWAVRRSVTMQCWFSGEGSKAGVHVGAWVSGRANTPVYVLLK